MGKSVAHARPEVRHSKIEKGGETEGWEGEGGKSESSSSREA